MGGRAVGLWVGEQKPLGKTPQRGNSSPESTYLPTYLMQWMHCGTCLMKWVSWLALHGQRKRGSISNDQMLISLAVVSKRISKGAGWQSQ